VAVVAVAGDHRIAVLQHRLDADDHRLLANIEMAEAADQAHAIELARLLLEAADQQHVAVMLTNRLGRDVGLFRGARLPFRRRFPGCHLTPLPDYERPHWAALGVSGFEAVRNKKRVSKNKRKCL
jgi:hypothetical protein